jgi:Anthranilate phosphoribosyltransferase
VRDDAARRRECGGGMIALTEKIRGGNDLSAFDVQEAAAFLLSDSIEAKTKADFLIALHEKGESASEIASFVRVLLERAVPLEIDGVGGPVIDVCGTGGRRHRPVQCLDGGHVRAGGGWSDGGETWQPSRHLAER